MSKLINVLEEADLKVVNRICEPIANTMQVYTGINCFSIAGFFAKVYVISEFGLYFHLGLEFIMISLILFLFFDLPWMVIYFVMLINMKAQYDNPSSAMAENPLKIQFSKPRITKTAKFTAFCIAGGVIGISLKPFMIIAVPLLAEILTQYFLSCTPLPPSASKAKLLLDKLKGFVTEALSPDLEPAHAPARRERHHM